MRIGQILIESELISPKQLSNGLEYGRAKGIALGRVLKLLKVMSEGDIERALETQKLIRMGLSPVLALAALKKAVKSQGTLESALQDCDFSTFSKSRTEKDETQAKAKFIELDYAAPPDKLIEKGDKLLLADQCEEAEANYLSARGVLERTLGRNHLDLTPVLIRLGNTYMATDRFEQAEECYEEVLILSIKSLPPNHPQIAQAYESLADLYRARGDEAESMENFMRALDILERLLPANLSLYASILRKVAAHTQVSDKPVEARRQPIGELLKQAGLLTDEQLQSALRMSKQTREPIGTVLRKNGMVKERDLQSALKSQFYVRQGVLTEALATELLSRAARRNISLERLLHEAAILSSDESRYETYREIATEVDNLVAAESNGGASHKDLAPLAYKVASLYEKVGDKPQAEIYYARALKIWEADIRGDLTAARACASLAKIHQSQNRMAEVVPLLFKALEHRQQALGSNHDETIETLEDIAEAEILQENAINALNFIRSALASREALGQEEAKLMRAHLLLGDCQSALNNYGEAEAAYLKATEFAQAGFGSASPALAAVAEKLGDLYSLKKEIKNAGIQYEYAMKILQRAGKLSGDAGDSLKEKAEKLKAL
ncbi:MAG: tetratricopeptide repeat protein [Candidatus Obscuribacterales bacterium]|nr:tetratricopeptide repeat protein [Candidatus Obscuribacterales bacterium]